MKYWDIVFFLWFIQFNGELVVLLLDEVSYDYKKTARRFYMDEKR